MKASNAAVRMRSRMPAEPSFPFGLDIGTVWYHTATYGTDWYHRLTKGGHMSSETIFQIHLVLGYVAWLLCFGVYVLPKLQAMDRVDAHRAIATFHSFRFFGLVFILPGVVDPHLRADFASFAAYWDLATGVLAMLALLTIR